MHSKLAGHLPLQEMIQQTIESARNKMAAAEEKKDEKVKKLVEYEKKEHGGKIPSVKEEKEEKKASINLQDAEEVEKLASALDQAADYLNEIDFVEKVADKVENGKESKGGGEQLANNTPVGGKQPYKHDKSKAHNIPMSSGMQAGDGTNGPAQTQVPNDHAKAPGGAPYPKKGVMKTAAESVLARIMAARKAGPAAPAKDDDKKDEKKAPPFAKKDDGEKKDEKKENPFAKKDDDKDEEKKASAVDTLLDKASSVYNGGESKGGGEQLSNTAPVPSNAGRELIGSNQAVINAKKVQAKAPGKKQLSEVLTEPAQSKAHDSKVHENLRNASKGGVKIAAAKAALQKIAAEGCTCSGKGECKYCKMMEAKKKMKS